MRKRLFLGGMLSFFILLFACGKSVSIEERVRDCNSSLLTDTQAISYYDKDHQNILMMASEVGCVTLVKGLIDKININETSEHGTTALFSAVENGNIDVIRILIEAGIDVHAKENHAGTTALRVAVERNELEIVKALLKSGASPNVQDTILGSTPLHMAVLSDRYELVKVLLQRGADTKLKARRLGTPLDVAMQKKNGRMVRLLELKE